MAGAALGSGVPDTLCEFLVDQTGGNPFVIEETIKALVAQQRLRAGDEGWTFERQDQPIVSEGLRTAITQQLDRLPTHTQEALRSASVLGRRFALEALALMSGSPTRMVEANLEPAFSTGMVDKTEDGYEFAHDRIRDVLYDGLALMDRRDAHLAAATALEKMPGRHATMAPLHWRLGGVVEAAIDGELAASDAAVNAGGLREALTRLETAAALARAHDVGSHRQKAVLEALGDVQRQLHPLRAVKAYDEALSSRELETEDRERLQRKRTIAQSLAGDLRAADLLPLPGDPTHLPQAQVARAYNRALQGDVAGARRILDVVGDVHDPNVACLYHSSQAIVAYLTGNGEECLRNARVAYELSRGEQPRRREMMRSTIVWQLLRYYLTFRADVIAQQDHVTGSARMGSSPDYDSFDLVTRSVRGYIAFFRGQWSEAADDFERVEADVSAAGTLLALPVLSLFGPTFWIAQGDLDRAQVVLESALDPLERCGMAPAFGLIPALVELAQVRRLRHDFRAAARRLDEATSLRSPGTVCVDGLVDVAAAELAIDQQCRGVALERVDEAMARARNLGDLLTQLECHRLLGVLGPDHNAHFNEAIELAERVGSPWLELRVLDRWSDVGSLPTRLLHERRSVLQAQLKPIAQAEQGGQRVLTNREIEVLGCVAEGLEQPGDRRPVDHQREDGRAPHRQHLHQDRHAQSGGSPPLLRDPHPDEDLTNGPEA